MDLSQIDPELDRMVNGPRKRRSQSASPLLEPETAGSMIDSLRENSLSTLSATGNALDLPGSMVRDVVAWKNPFDQLLTPFHSINRTTGRDLARKWGIARKRDTWGNAIGGMGIEMALDPLTYATLGASALGKAGQAAKAAGLMDDLGRVAARKAGKPLGMVGNREARMTTTLGDFLGEGGETAAKAQKIIDGGVSADEKLGGLLGVGLPFSDPIAILGQGERAQQVARGIDTLGRGIRFAKVPGTDIQPVNDFLNLFDAPAQGTKTAVGQAIAKEHARNLEKAKTAPRLEALRNIGDMEAAGLTDDASADLLRQGIEGIVPIDQLPVEMRPVANRMRAENAAMLPGDKAVGGRVSELTDDYADYGARHLTTKLDRRPSKGDLDISGYTPNSKARLDFIRNTEGGTVKLKNELFLDEDINRLIDSGKPVGEIAAEIERKHGSWLTKDYKTYKEKTKTWETAMGPFGKPASRYREIAEWMGKLSKETRESGIFGNHAILDHEARALASVELRKGAETLARSLNEAMLDSSLLRGGSASANASVDGSITVGQLVKDLGLSWRTKDAQGNVVGGFEDMIAKFAPNLAGTKTKDLKKMRLDARLAQDLKGTIRSISGPEEIGNIVKFVDSTTNFGKSLLTGVWPAFHVRNLVSGQMHNAMLGMWDRESAYGAAAMMRGGVLKGASQIPAVRAEWERRTGGTAPNAGVSQSVPAGPSPKSSGSAPMILDNTNDGYYSKLSQAVTSKVGGKTDWEQFKATMKGAGVKDEEIDDLGLEKFFAGGRRTKEEIQEYINDWKPEIKIIDKKGNKTHYSQYSIPGGEPESYREMLITAKSRNAKALDLVKQRNALAYDLHEKYGDGYLNEGVMNADDAARFSAAQKKADSVEGIDSYNEYASPHWREKNVVAHLRMDDIKNPDGTKTLRVTEIQSDWHQDGKKHGYYTESDATGPFKKSWSRLAFKQALKTAVEEGYDSVALVVGSDAAKAVGGPVKQMDEAYNIMLKDAKEYTKKYGSYSGETKAQGTVNANAGKPEIDLSFASFDRDNIARAFVPWSNDAPVGFIKKNEVLDPYAIIPAHFSLPEQHAMQRAQGEMRRRIEQGLPAHPDRFEVYKTGPNGDELIGKFGSQEEARFALAEATGHTTNNSFDGGMHVFKITDEMRMDILGKGQPRYMVLDGVSHDGKPYKYVTDPHSGNRKVLPDKPEWSPEFFSAISENHKRFNDSIEQAAKEGLINEIDADIARLIFSDASSEGIRIMSWPKLKDLKETYPSSDMEKVGGNFLWSMQNGWDFNIGLNKKFASSGPEDKGGSLLVLLHELGHMAEFYMKMVHRPADVINDPIKHIHMELGREASKALRAKKGNLLDNWTDLFGETTAKHVSQPIDGENIAQLFADSMLRRIKPEGKIRQIIGEIAHWIAGFLERLKLARPLTKKHTERVDELIGALMGFDGNTPQKLYAKDQDLIRAKLDKKYGKEPDYLGVGGGGVLSGGGNIFLGGQPGKPVLTDKEATRILGEIASSRNVIGKFEGNAASMSGIPNSNVSGDIQDVLSGVPRPGYESFDPARVGRKAIALEKDTTMNPIKTRGVAGQEQSKFGPAAAGEEVGHFAEGLNRLAPFINLLKKGYDVDEAARKVGTAQVMYGNKNFTKFETQVMARLFPFYKFTRSNVPFMAKHLIERPGGGYANVVRATNNAQEQGELAPDYVRETASIPVGDNPLLSAMIGKPKDGSDRYLTGFGLMHEDALAFGPSLRGAGLEVLSRMNPMVKGPLEYFTGQTFFQRGPEGGRRLDDLDPTLGRLMTNIGNITGMTDSDKAVKLPVEIEQALANSPASRVLSTARSLTDPRKQSNWGMLPFNVPGPAALMNTLTGARVTDVSPAAKEAIARDLLNAEMKNSGAKVFERIHFSNADKELMSPDVREQAEKLQALANHLAKLTKERKKEKAKESQQRK